MPDSPALTLTLLLLPSPLAICIVQAAVTRFLRLLGLSIAPQLLVLGIVLLGNIPILWLAWRLVLREFASEFLTSACGVALVLLTYNALGFCYFSLLNLSETSLHVHILMDLLLSGPMPSGQLTSRYSVGALINARVDRMIALGQLRGLNGRFLIHSRGLLTVG